MKKTIIIFVSILFVLFFGLKQVKAADGTWNYLPLGDNYLDPYNHSVVDHENFTYTFTTTNPFVIQETKVYSLHATYPSMEQITNYTFTFYDVNNNPVVGSNITEVKDENNRITSLYFTVPFGVKRLKMVVDFKHDLSMPNDYKEAIDGNFVFCLGSVYPGTSNVPVVYEGPREDLQPVFQGEQGLYITDVNNPVTVSEIKANLRAYDDTDGDVTASITVFEDNYTSFSTTLGTYSVIFRATDSFGNYTDFLVNVKVVDTEAPVIGGTLNVLAKNSTQINIEAITAGLVLSDNYDNVNNITLEMLQDNYSINYNVVGTYQIRYRATDASGNASEMEVSVIVEDDIAPIISGPFNHTKSNTLDVPIDEFISKYTANDETDLDITNRIEIISDNYTINQYNAGVWEVSLRVSDMAGNTTVVTIEVEVLDEVGPVFFIDKTKIAIDLGGEPLSIHSIINTLQETKIIKEDLAIEVLEDTYSENKDKPGTYKVKLGYLDEELDIEIEVLENIPEIVEEAEELGFFGKIGNFFSKTWKAIVNFFRFLFY